MLSLTSPLILFGLGMTGLTFWIFLFYPCKTSVKAVPLIASIVTGICHSQITSRLLISGRNRASPCNLVIMRSESETDILIAPNICALFL